MRAQKVRIWFSQLTNMIGGVATTHIIMHQIFTVQKEKLLRNIDSMFFNQIAHHNNLIVNFIKTSFECYCHFLHPRIRMFDQCFKPKNLGFFFDEENHERKSSNLCGRTCIRSLLVFLCQLSVVVLMLVCAIVRLMLSPTCEETTVWVFIN